MLYEVITPGQNDGRGKMGKSMHGGRIGEVVGRYVNRLNGGNGAAAGIDDPLLQGGQFGGQRRLIAEPGRQQA